LGVLIGLIALMGTTPGEAQAKKKPTATLTIQVKGLSKGSSAKVTVQGKGYRKKVTKRGRTVLKKLRLGRYRVKAKAVSVRGNRVAPRRASYSVRFSKRKRKRKVTVVYRQNDPPVASTISAGGAHTCAIRQSGQAVCWGYNEFGQLGNGANINRNVPVNVTGLGDARAISAGDLYTCAIRKSGRAVCWGSNVYGELGNGTSGDRAFSNVPVNVTGLGDAKEISAGGGHTCAIRQSGQAVCWGWNIFGQLGNGTSGEGAESNVPVNVRPD